MEKIGYFDKVSREKLNENLVPFTAYIKEPLSTREFNKLFCMMHNGDTAARTKIIEHSLYIVKELVDKQCQDPESEEYQTLFSNGVIVLLKAIDNFKEDYNQSFIRYAKYMCYNCINFQLFGEDNSLIYQKEPYTDYLDSKAMENFNHTIKPDKYIEHQEDISSLLRLLNKLDARAKVIVMKRYGLNCKPKSVEELAQELGLGETTIRDILKDSLNLLKTSLVVKDNKRYEDISLNVLKRLNDGYNNTFKKQIRFLKKEQINHLLRAIALLPANYQNILNLYLGLEGNEPLTMDEISFSIGTKKSNIQRVLQKSFDELYLLIQNMEIFERAEDPITFNFITYLMKDNTHYSEYNYELLNTEQKNLLNLFLEDFTHEERYAVSSYLGIDGYTKKNYTIIASELSKSISTTSALVQLIISKMSSMFIEYQSHMFADGDVSLDIVANLRYKQEGYTKYIVRFLPKEKIDHLINLIDNLPLKQMLIIKMYLGLNGDRSKTTKEISEKFGSSPSSISVALQRIYINMMEELKSQKKAL